MAINVLIGVGGTGAKIVETALMLMSAGVGPKGKVVIGLVDQDNSNGNVVRSEHLLDLLGRLRRDFDTGFNPGNAIDWSSEEGGGNPLFSIQLVPLFGEGGSAHWRPAPDNTPPWCPARSCPESVPRRRECAATYGTPSPARALECRRLRRLRR